MNEVVGESKGRRLRLLEARDASLSSALATLDLARHACTDEESCTLGQAYVRRHVASHGALERASASKEACDALFRRILSTKGFQDAATGQRTHAPGRKRQHEGPSIQRASGPYIMRAGSRVASARGLLLRPLSARPSARLLSPRQWSARRVLTRSLSPPAALLSATTSSALSATPSESMNGPGVSGESPLGERRSPRPPARETRDAPRWRNRWFRAGHSPHSSSVASGRPRALSWARTLPL